MKYLLLSILVLFMSCSKPITKVKTDLTNARNPLMETWVGDYGGVPPFEKVSLADFKPAVLDSMALCRLDNQAIVKNSEAPTFENTIVALEKSCSVFGRVMAIYGVWGSSKNNEEFQKIDEELAPQLAAFRDEFYQNVELFQRIEKIYNSKEKVRRLNPEQKRLLSVYYDEFVLNGARLTANQKTKVGEINKRLAFLSTKFSSNLLADEKNDGLVIDNLADLAGVPQALIDSAAREAAKKGLTGKWLIMNTRSSMEPFLTYATNRDLREKAFRKWTSRGENTNLEIISEIATLRRERSKIMGFQSYSHWRLTDSMAKDPDAAMKLMMEIWDPAVKQVNKEVADMQAIVNKEGSNFKIQPWDYRFYAEKVRKAKYDLDFEEVKPYLQLDNIRNAMFWMAKELYGLTFTQVAGVPVFHEDVTVYKVQNRKKEVVGLWYFDPFAREYKRSGAWMTSYREQERVRGNIITLVSNNSNFIKGKAGEPVLVSWDDAETMFHEFGHALHGLNSNVTYPKLSGTNTSRDFVEFPSQVHEKFFTTPQIMKFLKNKSGKTIPKELLDKIEKAKYFNQGFSTVEFLASGIVDMKLHLTEDKKIDAREFELNALKEIGMPSEIVMRHRLPHFSHLFADEGYASGYYGYLWAQVLDCDAYEAFEETGNPFDAAVAEKFLLNIMSVGNTVEPGQAYRNFRGRDAKVDALLRFKGFK